MFRETEYKNGTLHYLPSAPIRHIFWGYLKVGKVRNIKHPAADRNLLLSLKILPLKRR